MSRFDESDDGVSFVDCTAVAESDKALLVKCKDNDEFNETKDGRWVPKSCVHDDSEVFKKGDEGKFIVKTWWAEKNGLS